MIVAEFVDRAANVAFRVAALASGKFSTYAHDLDADEGVGTFLIFADVEAAKAYARKCAGLGG